MVSSPSSVFSPEQVLTYQIIPTTSAQRSTSTLPTMLNSNRVRARSSHGIDLGHVLERSIGELIVGIHDSFQHFRGASTPSLEMCLLICYSIFIACLLSQSCQYKKHLKTVRSFKQIDAVGHDWNDTTF